MVFEFKFPDVGEGVVEGKILQLKVRAGDSVISGDIIAVVETDKVVAEIPSPKDGTIKEIPFVEGQIIKVGEVLARIKVDAKKGDAVKVVEEKGAVVGELEDAGDIILPASGEGISDFAPESAELLTGRKKVKATPVARKLAADMEIDLTLVTGTGPAGRIMKTDIMQFAPGGRQREIIPEKRSSRLVDVFHEQKPVISTLTPDLQTKQVVFNKKQELTTLRKTLAKNMEKSQKIPVAAVHDFTQIDNLKNLRERINQRNKRVSFQPFFLKALALALKDYPVINSHYHEKSQSYTCFSAINIGFAVDTTEGLLVPVIKDIGNKSIYMINEEMYHLVEKARDRKLGLPEIADGTITITNYGAFAGIFGKPMILPPQVAIVGFGRIHQAPVAEEGKIFAATILPVSLAFDHRVVDGAPAGLFLKRTLELLANPEEMLCDLR
ncbi:dihydrolipoamide acetyltransferase family protein [Candidatus Riflebacteria bacterium]